MTNQGEKMPPVEASGLAVQAVLTAFLSRFAQMGPEFEVAAAQAFEAAAQGLEMTALQENDAQRKLLISNAASSVERMRDAALCGYADTEIH